LLASISWAASGSAAVIRVPEDYPTVLAGVDAAVAGDSVLVGPGTWTDVATRTVPIGQGGYATLTCCAFLKGGVTLIGTAGAENTVIQQGGVGESPLTLFYADYPNQTVALRGLTIVGGSWCPGINAQFAGSLELHHCVVMGTSASTSSFNAVYADWCDLLMEDTVVRDNATVIAVRGYESDIEIRRCRFENNPGQSVHCEGSGANCIPRCNSAVVEDCVFEETGLLGLGNFTSVTVARNQFLRMPDRGCAVWASTGSIQFNTFDHDSLGTAAGAGLWVQNLSGSIAWNTFYGCHSAALSGATVLVSASLAAFTNNVIAHSTGGPAVSVYSGATAGCNDYWANAGGNFGWSYPPGAQDLFQDPQFCDPDGGDFTVRSTSPCAEGNFPPCGQIGAHGVGCGPVAIEPTSWSRIKSDYRDERGE
jgi:hypothetical protein